MKSLPSTTVALLLSWSLVGCTGGDDSAVTTPSPNPSPITAGLSNSASIRDGQSDLQLVQQVFAELLNTEPKYVRPETTLAQLNADDLDIVEAVMEIEERLDISIPDAALSAAAGPASPTMALDRLTVQQFANVVTLARKKP